MNHYLLLCLFAALAFAINEVRGTNDEKLMKEIKEDILARYNKTYAPPSTGPFTVTSLLVGILIGDVDLKSGILQMKLYHGSYWIDSRLAYQEHLDNMTRAEKFLTFSGDQIWNPKFHPWNGFIMKTVPELLRVGYRGIVFQLEPITTETLCAFNDARYFPYDLHECDIVFSKFDRNGQSVRLKTELHLFHNEDRFPRFNHVWKIISPTYEKEIYKDIGGFEHEAVRLRFTLSRVERTFIWTAICPALSALLASSLSHLISPEDGTLVRLTLSGFSMIILTCVNHFFQHHIPLDIEKPPIAYTLCNLSLAMALISILQTVVVKSILNKPTGLNSSSTLTATLKNPLCQLVYWIWGWNDAISVELEDKKGLVADEEEGESDYASFSSLTNHQTKTEMNGSVNKPMMLVLVSDSCLFLALLIIFAGYSLFVVLL